MAQPLLPQEALRQRFEIYLNAGELIRVRAKAREARLPISTFVRHAALAQTVQAPPSEISIAAWQDMARVAGKPLIYCIGRLWTLTSAVAALT